MLFTEAYWEGMRRRVGNWEWGKEELREEDFTDPPCFESQSGDGGEEKIIRDKSRRSNINGLKKKVRGRFKGGEILRGVD